MRKYEEDYASTADRMVEQLRRYASAAAGRSTTEVTTR
jgi:hypothetical protein